MEQEEYDAWSAAEEYSSSFGVDEIKENPYTSVECSFVAGVNWQKDQSQGQSESLLSLCKELEPLIKTIKQLLQNDKRRSDYCKVTDK